MNCKHCGRQVVCERYLGKDYFVDIDGNDYCHDLKPHEAYKEVNNNDNQTSH